MIRSHCDGLMSRATLGDDFFLKKQLPNSGTRYLTIQEIAFQERLFAIICLPK